MDKAEAKRRFDEVGVPTPSFAVVDRAGLPGLSSRFPCPAVVKPVACGSSVDTLIVQAPDQLERAVGGLVERYGTALIEEYIRGPELTVGILGGAALPVCEIRTRREFYDYQAKYVDDDTQYRFDLQLPGELLDSIQAMSLRAHCALGCRDFSRVDWMVDESTLAPYALEVNTIPGFTSHSLLPKAAAEVGLSFDQLCGRIVELSLRE
jgi:D-alanine-D-alanine ligase